ncbi:hypothetical protein CsatB_018904 [Cannabis sativa]
MGVLCVLWIENHVWWSYYLRLHLNQCAAAVHSSHLQLSLPDLKKSNSGKRFSKKSHLRSEIVDLDDDFEANFQGFKDESDVEYFDDDVVDVKPFALTARNKPTVSRGKTDYLL